MGTISSHAVFGLCPQPDSDGTSFAVFHSNCTSTASFQ